MALKIKVVQASLLKHPVRNIALIVVGGTLLLGFVVCWSIFGYYYIKYEHIVDERLQKPLFEQTAKIYAAPKEVRVGQKLSARAVAVELRNAGYSSDGDRQHSGMGTYSLNNGSITIQPGPQSYHSEQGATVTFNSGLVSQISGDGGQSLEAYELEPELITGLSDQNRPLARDDPMATDKPQHRGREHHARQIVVGKQILRLISACGDNDVAGAQMQERLGIRP